MITVWHNPRCSKSRDGIKYLDEKGIEYEIRKYLDNPPSIDEIKSVLQKMNLKARDIVRTKESVYKELNLKEADEESLIEAMSRYPKLIERPIVINGDKAVVARPQTKIDEIL